MSSGAGFFRVPMTSLQELEWHLFFAIVFLTLAATLSVDRHVRVDALRQYFSERTLASIEIIGFVLALLLFCVAVTWFGTVAAWDSYWIGEHSAAARGLPWRWIVKSMVPIGGFLLLLAGICVSARNWGVLRGYAHVTETRR